MRIRLALLAVLLFLVFGCGGGGGGSTVKVSDTTSPVTTALPAGGTFSAAQTVTLSASKAATIYYTLDGSSPTTSSAVYNGPLTISANTTLKYFAKDAAGNVEQTKSQLYTIDGSADPGTLPPVTSASPAGGSYSDLQTVTLTANKDGSTIYYTIDGSTPTTSSSVYLGPLTLASSVTLRYFAKDSAGNVESVKSQVYSLSCNFFPLTPYSSWTYKDSSNTTVAREVTNDGRITTQHGTDPVKYSTYTITASNAIALTSESVTTGSVTITSLYSPGSLVLPSILVPGFSQDGGFTLTVGSGSPSTKTGTVAVAGVESVTVPAGTFQALRIDSVINGASSSSWYANGVGLVKDSSMQLVSYQVK